MAIKRTQIPMRLPGETKEEAKKRVSKALFEWVKKGPVEDQSPSEEDRDAPAISPPERER